MKIIISTLLVFISLQCHVQAQNRASERRKEKEEANKNRNKSNNESRAAEFFSGYEDKGFEEKTVPDKWKAESAVIICQTINYEYDVISALGSSYPVSKKQVRKRILLQDKNAVENFSTLYTELNLTNKERSEFLCIKIIKPNGTEKIITPSDAIEAEATDVPRVFRGYTYLADVKYYKIAVPDLEVGDIFDFITYEKIYNQIEFYYPLEGGYPCMKQNLDFVLDRSLFLAYKSTKGAPALKEYETESRSQAGYEFTDIDRPALKDEQFFIDRYEVPTIKIKVMSANVGKNYANFVSEEKKVAKTEVTSNDVLRRANSIYNKIIVDKDKYASVTQTMRKYHSDLTNKDKIVQVIYNTLRQRENMYYTVITRSGNTNTVTKYYQNRWYDEDFFITMIEVLKKYDISCDVLAIPIRNKADINSIAFVNEILYAIKYNDKIIYAPSIFSTLNISDVSTQGQDAYLLKLNDRVNEFISISPFKMPVVAAAENKQNNTMRVNILDNMETLKISDTNGVSGVYKFAPDFNVFKGPNVTKEDSKLLGFEYKKEKYEESDDEDKNLNSRSSRKRELAEEKRSKARENKLDAYQSKKESIIDGLKKEFGDVIALDTAFIASTGRMQNTDEFVLINNFQTNGFIKKLGSNYSLEIAKLIGSQKEIKQNEINRIHDIYFDVAKSINNKIYLDIPAGYKVEGFEGLNINVDNGIGKFVSTAVINGNTLIITTNKEYKVIQAPKSDWSLATAFLDAAYNFTQKKLILKKI